MNKTQIRKTCLAVAGAFAFSFASNAMADATSDVVNALVAKGVLTEEEGDLLVKGRALEQEAQKKKEKGFVGGKMNIRGYVQIRNTAMLGGDKGVNLWSDRSVGDDQSLGNQDHNFLIRRARIIFSGDVGDRLSYYIQPDFASSVGGTSNSNSNGAGHFAQLRDAYGDVYITKDRVHRVRLGQSKVPYGFENLQSSSNRLGLDRADALNSAVRDERDLGAFYYYTPDHVQKLFEEINKAGLKHSGNYGMFALGLYNGQGANAREQNDNYHVVSRFTYPWKTETGQIFEAGIQAYHGKYMVTPESYRTQLNRDQVLALNDVQVAEPASPDGTVAAVPKGCGTVADATQDAAGARSTCTPSIGNQDRRGIDDERIGVSFMMYPQPFGLQAEWNWGRTPGLDIATNTIKATHLNGGYVQAMYKIDNFQLLDTNGTLIPFIRWQYFDGANKAESNATRNTVNDWELGTEWQIAPEVEFTAVYHYMNRTNLVKGANGTTLVKEDYDNFKASALRMQLQYNF